MTGSSFDSSRGQIISNDRASNATTSLVPTVSKDEVRAALASAATDKPFNPLDDYEHLRRLNDGYYGPEPKPVPSGPQPGTDPLTGEPLKPV